MLATFTSDNSVANFSNSKVPCSMAAISHISSYQRLVAVAFSDAVFVAWHGE